MDPGPLAKNVLRLRTERGLTQPELSKATGGKVAQGAISKIEKGITRRMAHEKLVALARALGVTPNALHAEGDEDVADPTLAAFLASDIGAKTTPEERLELLSADWGPAPPEAWFLILQAIRLKKERTRGGS